MSLKADQVIALLSQIGPDSFESYNQRAHAVTAVKKLLARLQTPWDHVYSLTWMEVIHIYPLVNMIASLMLRSLLISPLSKSP